MEEFALEISQASENMGLKLNQHKDKTLEIIRSKIQERRGSAEHVDVDMKHKKGANMEVFSMIMWNIKGLKKGIARQNIRNLLVAGLVG